MQFVVVSGIFVVGRFDVHLQEAVELQHLAGSDKAVGHAVRSDVYDGFFHLGISHLRSDGSFPNQVVEFLFLSGSGNVVVADESWTNGFVRLLRALCGSVIFAHLHILFAERFGDFLFY